MGEFVKVDFKDDKIIVFLNNKKYLNSDSKTFEKYLKKIFSKLENYIPLDDYYDVFVYKDNYYGVILEFKSSDSYFFDSYDMNIVFIKSPCFLYEVNYNFIEELKGVDIYKYKNKFYLKVKNETIFTKILEYSDIIYGEYVLEVLKRGKKVSYEEASCSTFGTT